MVELFLKVKKQYVGKGEIARYEQFSFSHDVFPKTCTGRHVQTRIVWETVNSVANNKILDLSK